MGNRYFHTMRVRVMMLRGMCEGRDERTGERASEGARGRKSGDLFCSLRPSASPCALWRNPRRLIIAQVREEEGEEGRKV